MLQHVFVHKVRAMCWATDANCNMCLAQGKIPGHLAAVDGEAVNHYCSGISINLVFVTFVN